MQPQETARWIQSGLLPAWIFQIQKSLILSSTWEDYPPILLFLVEILQKKISSSKKLAASLQIFQAVGHIVGYLNSDSLDRGVFSEYNQKLQDSNAAPMSFPLQFLKAITCDFSTELELGRGGYGVVYKGVLPNGKIIAVKKLFEIHLVDDKTFQNEVNSLMDIKHQHVVQFIGYCAESSWETIKQPSGNFIWAEMPKRFLCFEYLCNKSLDKYISVPTDESQVLEWNMRYEIIKGICSGLNFLHEECRLVHLDLKPENILMDAKMIPKIADFGLSRIFGNQQSRILTNNSIGSRGYMAPEYLIQGIISMKADIFSLGVLIIEIITGRRDYPYFQLDSPQSTATSCHHFTEQVLASWRYKFESTLKYISMENYNQQVKQCITIALKCVDPNMERRPTAKDIIQLLNAVDQVTPGSLLDVYPPELCFRFEPKKLITCSLDLTNNTSEKVAYALVKKTDEHTCFFDSLPLLGIVEPGTTYTHIGIMNKQANIPQERNMDLILHTATYYEGLTEEELANTVHKVTLKCVCALQGETIFESVPPSIKIISMEDKNAIGGIHHMDANQPEPLVITGHSLGYALIWNYDTQEYMGSIQIQNKVTAASVKLIARKGWCLVASKDGFIHVYDYKREMQKITSFKADQWGVKSVVIHPTKPYVLSSGREGIIKLWDWDHGWKHMQTFKEDSEVNAIAFNPEDNNSFASVSDYWTIKVWSLDSPEFKYTLSGHSGSVWSLYFFTRDGQQHLITGSADNTAKIWNMQTKECVRTLPHTSGVSSIFFHAKLPLLVTGTLSGHVYFWSSTDFRLKRILKFGDRKYLIGFACSNESGRVLVAHSQGVSVIEIRNEEEQGGSSSNNENSISAAD